MHPSAYRRMKRAIRDFVPRDRRLTVVDLGSGTSAKRIADGMTHKALLERMGYDAEVIGVDVVDRLNVDVVMPKPYTVPLKSNSVDLVLAGQVFEHIPFPWASTMEIARLLKPGGILILTAPSQGHFHTEVDCWRYYEDAIRALAAYTGLRVRRARTDHPARSEGKRGRIYDIVDDADQPGYWGDTVGVLQKPEDFPRFRMALVRVPSLWWANRKARAFVSHTEAHPPQPRGKKKDEAAPLPTATPQG